MIRKLLNLFLDRHINRGFKQLEAGSRASERDEKAAWIAEIDARLAARKGVETRRRAA